MGRDTIDLFMWGYQSHFNHHVKYLMNKVLEKLGTDFECKTLLIGVLQKNGHGQKHPICVEPEYDEWPLELFSSLLEAIEHISKNHPEHSMFYGDERTMRQKPERILRSSISQAVGEALEPFDSANKVKSFCGIAYPVDDYYVVPVIQMPLSFFEDFPPLTYPSINESWRRFSRPSLAHTAVALVLEDVREELRRPDPGASLLSGRDPAEIVRQAAAYFLGTPGLAINDLEGHSMLYERLNLVSSLMYEGTRGQGRLILARADHPDIQYLVRFEKPIPFREIRWVRKILQMASPDIALIATCSSIFGLGTLSSAYDASAQDIFEIDFTDHYTWEIRSGTNTLVRVRYGDPTLPSVRRNRLSFIDTYCRLFKEASELHAESLWKLIESHALTQEHGSSIIVADDAELESSRLSQQGTRIQPAPMTPELFSRVSGIDGSILLNSRGICYAIGVILDGPANDACTPSRGSRYNSAIRYVQANRMHRLAIVVSQDHTVDIIPLLRPRIERGNIEAQISALERADLDNYHRPRLWLDENRFYLNDDQCARVNITLDRIDKIPREGTSIRLQTTRFSVHPDLDETYFF